MKDLYTTFDIARFCRVDITTVIKWITTGKLTGYRTPGGHRRVRRRELLGFLKRFDLPIPRGVAKGTAIAIGSASRPFRQRIKRHLKAIGPAFSVYEAEAAFSLGKIVAEKQPSAVIIDLRLLGGEGSSVTRPMRNDRRLRHATLLFAAEKISTQLNKKVAAWGGDGCIALNGTREQLKGSLRRMINGE